MKGTTGLLLGVGFLALAACDRSVGPAGPKMVRTCPSGALYVAYQTEGGAWTRLQPNDDEAYVMPAVTGSVTTVVVDTSFETVWMRYHFTTGEELGTTVRAGCTDEPVSIEKDIVLENGPSTGNHLLFFGTPYGSGGKFLLTEGPVHKVAVPDGEHDLVAVIQSFHNQCNQPNAAQRVIVKRDVNANAIPALDWNVDGADALSHTVTVEGLNAGQEWQSRTYFHAKGTVAQLDRNCFATATSVPYSTVPASLLEPGDVHEFIVYTRSGVGRVVQAFLFEGEPLTVTLGAEHQNGAHSIVSAAPTVRYRVDVPRHADYSSSISAGLSQPAGDGLPARSVSLRMTSGYARNAPAWAIEMPEPPSDAAWRSEWRLTTEPLTACGFSVFGHNFETRPNRTPASGDILRTTGASCM